MHSVFLVKSGVTKYVLIYEIPASVVRTLGCCKSMINGWITRKPGITRRLFNSIHRKINI
jgi:hypothetical protein